MAKPIIVTRSGKGSALTWAEGDSNWTNLQNATFNITDGITTVSNDLNSSLTITAGSGISLQLNNITKSLTITSTATSTSVLQQLVLNLTGSTISKGKAVYISGANGNNPLISLSSNASEATSSKTLGLVVTDIAQGFTGYVISDGLLEGLDTSTAQIGDAVWLGTSGNLLYGLTNKPDAPAHMVYIGVVVRVNQNNGAILVKVQNGFELNELHNVLITTTPSDGQVLTYESATNLYKMKTPTGGASVTGFEQTFLMMGA